ncbi:MAG: MFS transporter, partial [Afipia sp.]
MTDTSANAWVSSTHRPMGFREFVAIVAAIMALNPLAMDLMLPGLPDVAKAFKLDNINHAQAVLSVFLTGFGAGQFIIGPLADRFGRRPVLIGGLIIYGIASLLAIIA